MDLEEQKNIMSIDEFAKFESDYISDVVASEYEFNRYDKSNIDSKVSVLKLEVDTRPYSNWNYSIKKVWEEIILKFPIEEQVIFCFLSSPYWQKDSRIIRYYGLSQSLSRKYKIKHLEFEFEKVIIQEGDIVYYGIVKLTEVNAREIFDLISDCENGVLFTWPMATSNSYDKLVNELAKLVAIKNKSKVCHLDIVKAVNLIIDEGCSALYPYAWEETGTYHLDIFTKTI
jgi:hypothetical protein